MIWRYSVMGMGLLALLAGCQGTDMAGEQQATAAAAAANADDDPTAEDRSGEIVGGGPVGGDAGDLGAQLPDVGEFRNPRLGRGGSLR
jgi:hypothetical protein